VPGYLQRPFPDRIDRVVDHFLGGYRLADDATRAAVRTAIHLDHAQTLGAYGERMATLAVRERSVDLLARGLLAAMLRGNCPQEDLRDVLVSIAPLQRSAERLGVDPEDEFERAAALAGPDTPRALRDFPRRKPRDRGLAAFHFVERDDDGGLLYQQIRHLELLRLPADVRETLDLIATMDTIGYLREPLANDTDDRIASLLDHLARSAASQRRDLRRALWQPHAQALRVFAQRMATLTVQTASQPVLVRGLTAALLAARDPGQDRTAILGVLAILADAAGRADLDFRASFHQGERLTGVEAQLPADLTGRFDELVAALDELDELLRKCNMLEQAAWIRRARDDRDFQAVRHALAGMGSISDVSLNPPPGSRLTQREAYDKRDELCRRLGRLTDPSPNPPGPSGWAPINGFRSPGEYSRFQRWIADRVSRGQAEAVEVGVHRGGVTSQIERWYRHVESQEIWRLVEPDPPSRGVFLRVDPARPDR